MQAHIKSFILIILMGSVSVGFVRGAAAPPGKEPATTAGDPTKASVPSFPYAAEITDDDAPIRSGPGTNYYICGKLNKANKVNVVGSQFSWSRIVPPAGSFSWISMRYISIDPDNPAIGIVTADGIRIYAGSEYREPIHSETLQLKLNRGDKVKLMGKQKADYYKIAPPTGAYLWISTKYTKPLVAVGEVPRTVVVSPTVDTRTDTKTLIRTNISVEREKLKEYSALEKQIQAERAKPIDQQNYANIEKALKKIADNKEAGKAVRYSEFAIKQIKRFELALKVAEAVRLQNENLQETKKGIEKARATRLAQAEKLGRFAVIGQFQTSSIYSSAAGLKHYRITRRTGDTDATVCYALPVGPASKMDVSKLAGLKVGLIGTIEPHPQTARVLVKFTEIIELN